MSFIDVLFKPTGRIQARQFWAGWGVLVAANIIANFMSFLGIILYFGLIYVGICVYGKRLHDMGRSAWLVAIPWGIGMVLGFIGIFMSAPAILEATQYDAAALEDPETALTVMGPFFSFIAIGFIVWAGLTLWVGLGKTDPSDNKYGPGPGGAATAFI